MGTHKRRLEKDTTGREDTVKDAEAAEEAAGEAEKEYIVLNRQEEEDSPETERRRLADYAERFDEEAFLKNDGMECCECGCCSFICPAKRPLTQQIKSMRKIQLARKKK